MSRPRRLPKAALTATHFAAGRFMLTLESCVSVPPLLVDFDVRPEHNISPGTLMDLVRGRPGGAGMSLFGCRPKAVSPGSSRTAR
ncbi:MAG: hypothetical protein EHM37_21860 [Deltaproteobacteria bacterium]|nr:MAG: hypothetical protein EHM37_21860 [Deltaproteobacteria bacterium]